MGPIENYTDEEINEIIFKIGDIIMDIELGDKILPDNMKAGWFMLLAAHSMLGDAHPASRRRRQYE
jgi:hypothetical protein